MGTDRGRLVRNLYGLGTDSYYGPWGPFNAVQAPTFYCIGGSIIVSASGAAVCVCVSPQQTLNLRARVQCVCVCVCADARKIQ